MIEAYLLVDGLNYVFCSGHPSSYVSSPIEHAIANISTISSTIDPTEPFVDSSTVTITLAADASAKGYPTVTPRYLFTREPISLGFLADDFLPSDDYVTVQTEEWIDGSVCIGCSTYEFVGVEEDDGILTCEVYGIAPSTQNSAYYIDRELGLAPEITDSPRVWKGRLAFLFLSVADIPSKPWRIFELAENPRINSTTVELSVVQIDARIRDHHVGLTVPTVAHFAQGGRQYSRNRKQRRLFFYGNSAGPQVNVGELNTATSFAIGSGTAAYAALYSTIQDTITTPAGERLLPGGAGPIFTPVRPPICKNWGRWNGILGRSGQTVYLSDAVTANEFSLQLLPAVRMMLTSSSDVAAVTAFATRTAVKSHLDPMVNIYTTGDTNDCPTTTIEVTPTQTSAFSPVYRIGFFWQQNEPGGEKTVPVGAPNIGEKICDEFAICRDAATSADSESGFWAAKVSCDNYSFKIISAPNASIDQFVTHQESTGAMIGKNRQLPMSEHVAFFDLDPSATISVAQAQEWWCPGETDLILDQRFAEAGQTIWLTATWTENGDDELTRHFKATYIDQPATGFFRYEVGEGLRQNNWAPNIAGVGDWFGYRATFAPDTYFAGDTDADLFLRYLGSSRMQGSLFFSSAQLDRESFRANAYLPNLLDSWRFADAEELDKNLGALLMLSSTAISFRISSTNGYRVARKWFGRATKDEEPVPIDDELLLEIPVAALDDQVIAEYTLKFIGDKTVSYVDRMAKALFNAEKTFELDLSECALNTSLSPNVAAKLMRGTLASLVERFGGETLTYSLVVPFWVARDLAPGDLIVLTSSQVVGPAGAPNPKTLECRLLEVEHDLLAQRSSLKAFVADHRVAKYQRGCRVLGGFGTTTVTVDDVSWIVDGSTVTTPDGTSRTISSHSSITSTVTFSSAFPWQFLFWQTAQQSRFLTASDPLA